MDADVSKRLWVAVDGYALSRSVCLPLSRSMRLSLAHTRRHDSWHDQSSTNPLSPPRPSLALSFSQSLQGLVDWIVPEGWWTGIPPPQRRIKQSRSVYHGEHGVERRERGGREREREIDREEKISTRPSRYTPGWAFRDLNPQTIQSTNPHIKSPFLRPLAFTANHQIPTNSGTSLGTQKTFKFHSESWRV